tara:strand:- start:60 stop:446 length:387 start_codon:yes stop_codon:yes gene_type:complete
MTVKVTSEMRKRINNMKSYMGDNNNDESFIYESPDGGKTVYRRRFAENKRELIDDVSGVEVEVNDVDFQILDIRNAIFRLERKLDRIQHDVGRIVDDERKNNITRQTWEKSNRLSKKMREERHKTYKE